jgi:2-oxoglutarate ferredoxin oxidoreductase subunit gamma
MRQDVRLAGVGGQGLILAGMILGEAASIFGPLNAVQTQSYAPLVRGAPSMSEVVISDEPIDYPMVEQADVLLALVQDAFDEHRAAVRPGGTIIVEESAVDSAAASAVRVLRLPLAATAARCGAPPIAATMVGLGVVARVTGLVSDEALRAAVRLRVPREGRDLNLAAMEAGLVLATALGGAQ